MTAIRHLTAALALAALAAIALGQHTQGVNLADPFYCVVIKDGQGNPVDTVCVPAP